MTEKKVVILMATYNGQKYLKCQLDSIIQQTYRNWQLIIRDDCSKDNTVKIENIENINGFDVITFNTSKGEVYSIR